MKNSHTDNFSQMIYEALQQFISLTLFLFRYLTRLPKDAFQLITMVYAGIVEFGKEHVLIIHFL